MEKRLFVQLNGNRKVLGILRGYDVRLSTHVERLVANWVLGILEHSTRRRGGGEGWWRESSLGHGGMVQMCLVCGWKLIKYL